jgi:anhydro-N-acetylmuramic acid kinase
VAHLVLTFIEEFKLEGVGYVALHGHTIFHRPQDRLTVQAGNLAAVAAITRIDTVGNFRELDVMKGGEGAPLAPFG